MKWKKLNINNRDCRGLYIMWELSSPEITSEYIDSSNFKIKNDYKLQIRLKINSKITKKTYIFPKTKTLRGAIDFVNSNRLNLISEYKERGTLKPKSIKPIKKITFDEIWDSYIVELQSSTRLDGRKPSRDSTIRQYKYVHELYHKSITIENAINDINELVKKMEKEGKTPAYITYVVAPLKQMFKDIVNVNQIRTPRVDNKRVYTYNIDQTKTLVEAMQTYEPKAIRDKTPVTKELLHGIYAFLLDGRRINEVLTLDKKDINLLNMTYTIRKKNSKIDKELVFNLNENLLRYVENIKSGLVFEGISNRSVRKFFYRMLNQYNLPKIHLHDIRHAVATVSINAGANIADVSRALGHSNISTTEKRYVNKTPEMASRATSIFREVTQIQKK